MIGPMMRVVMFTLALIALVFAGAFLMNRNPAKAQGFGVDIKPYAIAPATPNGTIIYKGVYQGCEYFLAENARGNGATASITTFGTGCK